MGGNVLVLELNNLQPCLGDAAWGIVPLSLMHRSHQGGF